MSCSPHPHDSRRRWTNWRQTLKPSPRHSDLETCPARYIDSIKQLCASEIAPEWLHTVLNPESLSEDSCKEVRRISIALHRYSASCWKGQHSRSMSGNLTQINSSPGDCLVLHAVPIIQLIPFLLEDRSLSQLTRHSPVHPTQWRLGFKPAQHVSR